MLMKKPINHTHIYILLLTLFMLVDFSSEVKAQIYNPGKHWYVGPHLGLVSFFGDLSIHDFNPVRKITDESKFGWGFLVGKGINPFLDAQFSFTKGGMKGSNPDADMKFNNSFTEMTLGPEINISQIIWPNRISRFNLTAKAAVGMIQYRSIKNRLSDGAYLSSVGLTPDRENTGTAGSSLIFPVGFGLNYRLNFHWTMTSNFALRLHNKDMLDVQVGSTGISDRYSYGSLGIVYVFAPADKPGIKAMECPGDYLPAKKRRTRKY